MKAPRWCPTRHRFLAGCAAAAATARAGEPPAGVSEFRRGGMVYRQLGRNGMEVSLLSFGSHTDPADRVSAGRNLTVLSPPGQQRRDRIISRALDRGVNLLDVGASEG